MVQGMRGYLFLLVAFAGLDLLWIGVVARGFYRKHLGFWLAPQPNWPAVAAFYLLFALGLFVLAGLPGRADGSLGGVLLRAALMGLASYGAYDLTNQATVQDWPLVVTVVDMAWGTLLCTASAAIGHLALRWPAR